MFRGTPSRFDITLLDQRVLFLLRLLPELFLAAASPGALSAPAGSRCSYGSSPICSEILRPACYGSRPCSSCFCRRCRFRPRLWLCDGRVAAPFRAAAERDALTARAAPLRPLYANCSCCSSFPNPIHSSCRRRLPCSPSPKRAVPPHVVRHHASRSLPRCVRLSAAACWCKTTCRPVAWS